MNKKDPYAALRYKEFNMFFAPYQKNRYKLINSMKGNI